MSAYPARQKRADGGYGYIVLAGCFAITSCVYGLLKCNGFLVVLIQERYDAPYSVVSFIPMVQKLVETVVTIFASFLAERYGQRPFIIAGGFGLAAATFSSGFAPNIPFLIVSYGIAIGISTAFMSIPTQQMLPLYFERKLPMAASIVFSGGSIGVLSLPFLISVCNKAYGLSGVFIILAGVNLQIVAAGMLMRPVTDELPEITQPVVQTTTRDRSDPDKSIEVNETQTADEPGIKPPAIQAHPKHANHPTSKFVLQKYREVVTNPRAIVFIFGWLMFITAYSNWMVFQQAHVKDRCRGNCDSDYYATLSGIAGGVEIFARLGFGVLLQANMANKWMAPYRFPQMSFSAAAVLMFTYVYVEDRTMWVVYSAMMSGVISLAIISLLPAVAHIAGITRTGIMISFLSIATGLAFVTVVISGKVRDVTGSFVPIYWTGSVLLILGVLLLEVVAFLESRSIVNRIFACCEKRSTRKTLQGECTADKITEETHKL